MTETDIAERIRDLIDSSAPAVSADDALKRPRLVPVQTARSAGRSRLNRALVISYCAMALALVVALVVGLSLTGGPAPSKTSPAAKGSHNGASTAGREPFADVAATPDNWSPISYGNVQISVPSDWIVYSGGNCFAAPADLSGCANASSEVSITANAQPLADGRPVEVNGIRADLEVPGPPAYYIENALGMQIHARGALAKEIVGTLTYAPDYAIIHKSGTTTPPGSWRTVNFGGISFRAPGTWTVQRDSWWGGCPGSSRDNVRTNPVIRLSTAQSYSTPICPAVVSDAASWAAAPGVVVGAGPAVLDGAKADTTGDECLSSNGLRVCIEPIPLDGGSTPGLQPNLLTALVFIPGHARPDQVEIGLDGTGQNVQAIFDSMRAATS